MIDAVAFRTRARTIDHLGREQIADCPTAISELWKNAYDAYAHSVALHIFDGEPAIATVVDDGHGMSRDEFVDRWLTVGTESKLTGGEVRKEDRNGLPFRAKQGQKGIGRLSAAAMGPLLLVVSKRRIARFVAALIDWRLFENPFLYLQDVEIPVVEFDEKEELFQELPGLFDTLMGNLWGSGKDSDRDRRIAEAWKQFDEWETAEGKPSTRSAMETVVIDTAFTARHLCEWPVWGNEADSGTLLAVSDIGFDLLAQLDTRGQDDSLSSVKQARDRLFQTLSNFSDPYLDNEEERSGYGTGGLNCSAIAWEGGLQRPLVSEERQFDYRNLESLEHIVDGEVDVHGIFKGHIRAFGNWLEGEITINPEGDVPTRANSRVGPFHLRIGAFEPELRNTTHAEEVFRHLEEQAERYAGLRVYRNGLRVMPYGREDNDFFEIEKRRTKHAGREFWSYRRLFGRVAIRREDNPNLRDKAGREGLIDNKAAKTFRDLVINILETTARNYFGTDSGIRKKTLPEIQHAFEKRKAEEARKQQAAKRKRQFRANLRRLSPEVANLVNEIMGLAEILRAGIPESENDLLRLREQASELKRRLDSYALGPPPKNLSGSLEQTYTAYRHNQREASELILRVNESLKAALDDFKSQSSRDMAYSELSRNATFIQNRLRAWYREIKKLLAAEQERLTALYEERNKTYHTRTLPLLDDLEHDRLSLNQVLDELEQERIRLDSENVEAFESYLLALQSLQESIDLTSLAEFGMDQVDELREEIDRLHGLAQLGITVEIIGHEIEGLEHAVTSGLNRFPEEVRQTPEFRSVFETHTMLMDRLRFLSPLKLSGSKAKTELTGRKILEYLGRFFGDSLGRRGIHLEASQEFLNFSIYELTSRVYPVFINLVNNASYWVTQSHQSAKRILLDAADGKVIVADDGPGVEQDDVSRLFTLFFTRRVRGGRGVGLYLCRVNLAAGGHKIAYVTENRLRKLPGANFIIDFRGARYG